jgi:hypothetical protein
VWVSALDDNESIKNPQDIELIKIASDRFQISISVYHSKSDISYSKTINFSIIHNKVSSLTG